MPTRKKRSTPPCKCSSPKACCKRATRSSSSVPSLSANRSWTRCRCESSENANEQLKLQCRDRVGGCVDDDARKKSENKHAEHAEAEGDFDGRGNLNGRQISGVFGPIDRPHDTEIVVKRNHHTDDGHSDEPVVGVVRG